jgi:WD40 repeat protein
MLLKTQAATEIAQFLASHPTPEQIVAFSPTGKILASGSFDRTIKLWGMEP